MHDGPVRTCVACRRRFPQHQLLRVARTTEGPRFDATGHLPGRGAYVCDSPRCVAIATRHNGKALFRALRYSPNDDLHPLLDELRAATAPTRGDDGKEHDE